MEEFSSLNELNKYIEEYEQTNYVQLWKRDTRNIESMKRVLPNKLKGSKSELKYYSLTFACSRGGRKFKTKSVGLRDSFTTKDGCPMNIKIKLSADGQKLQIGSINETHNHTIDKDAFHSLPKQRRLNSKEKDEAQSLLQLKFNKKLLQAYLQNKTGKSVQLRDISNLKNSKRCSVSNLENVLKILDINDNLVHVAVDENNTLLGIYYQTPWMQSCFAAYPELFMLDGVYKLNNLNMMVYVIMTINGNNEGDPAAIFAVAEDNTDIICHMIKVFKENNPDWTSVKTILTDKDFEEPSILYTEFPDASHQFSIFHLLKRFRTALSDQLMNINSAERNTCLKLLQKIVFCKTESEYNYLYETLMDLNLENVSYYYNENWHGIKEEWVEFYRNSNLIYGVQTTNHLESFNQKLKQLCDKFVNLESFFEIFNILLNNLTAKRNQTANTMLLKKQVTNFEEGSTEDCYLNFLTPHAFKLVHESIQKSSDCEVITENNSYSVISEDNSEKYRVDKESYECTCVFYNTNFLPCCHIFAAKCKEDEHIYDEFLVHRRHLKSTYIQQFKSSSHECNLSQDQDNILRKKPKLSTQRKYKIALSKCEKIANIISNFNLEDFNESCEELDTLMKCWKQRKRIKVCLKETAESDDEEL